MPHPVAPYTKPGLSTDDLLAHLQRRGLILEDLEAARAALRSIGYYRLLVYMRPLQQLPDKTFRAGTTFADVLALYDFDRELRLLCMDAVERIEVALRSAIVNELSVAHGPHFYLESRHFEAYERFREFLQTVAGARYVAVEHYTARYNTPSLAPIWAVMEAVTFGALSRLYSGLRISHRKAVARWFGYDEKVLVSWFRAVNTLRNRSAHHNRLWNSDMRVDQPIAAKALAGELAPTSTFYARAVVLAALLAAVGQGCGWKRRLAALVARFPTVSVAATGFPADWRERALWKAGCDG